jgi:thiol-disulfide isomerase/thioredoxin
MNKLLIVIGAIVVVVLAFALTSTGAKTPYADDKSPVMYFYSETCSHCIAMKPILAELAAEGYRVKMMNAGADASLWQTYSITGTPTWLAANNERIVGEQSKEALRAWFDAHGAKIA